MIYDKLLRLPLFTGMDLSELKAIMGKTKIDFGKFSEGDTIVRHGDKCGKLLIVLDGEIKVTTFADNNTYHITEFLSSPVIIHPERIFGRFQDFPCDVKAVSAVNTITMDKKEVLSLLSQSFIFHLNFINILSTGLQKREQALWLNRGSSVRDLIILFVREHCISPTGHKILKIKMETLATLLNTRRLNVSKALRELQSEKALISSRGKIDIPEIRNLVI